MAASDWEMLLSSFENNRKLQLESLFTGFVHSKVSIELRKRVTETLRHQLKLQFICTPGFPDVRFFSLRNRIDECIGDLESQRKMPWFERDPRTVTERVCDWTIDSWKSRGCRDHIGFTFKPSVIEAEITSGIYHLLQTPDGMSDLVTATSQKLPSNPGKEEGIKVALELEELRAPKRLFLGVVNGMKKYLPK
jgi:hypothetical protein